MHTSSSKADLHIHTIASDGAASVPALLEYIASSSDLHLIAITDHDTITGARQAAQLARQFGIEVIVGEEVSTLEGHLLALFIDALLPAGRPAAETIAAIHAQSGLAVAPHPFDRSVPSLGLTDLRHPGWHFDAIEGFNSSVIWSQRDCNRVAQQAAASMGLPIVGGSDAHTLATIGFGYTIFPGASADDLYRAIQSGDVDCAGHYWGVGEYIDMGYQLLRQHSLRKVIGLATAGAGLSARPQ